MLENPPPMPRPLYPGQARLPGRGMIDVRDGRRDGIMMDTPLPAPTPAVLPGSAPQPPAPGVETAPPSDGGPAAASRAPSTTRGGDSRPESPKQHEAIIPIAAAAGAAGAAAALGAHAMSQAPSRRSAGSPMMTGARPLSDHDFDTGPSGTPLRSSTESVTHVGHPPRVVPRPHSVYSAAHSHGPRDPSNFGHPESGPPGSRASRPHSRRDHSPASSSSSDSEPERKSKSKKKDEEEPEGGKKKKSLAMLGTLGVTALGLAAQHFHRVHEEQRAPSNGDAESRRARSRERRSSSQDTARPPAQVESVSSSHSSVMYEEDEYGNVVPIPHAGTSVSQVHMDDQSVFSDDTLAPSDSGSQIGGRARRVRPSASGVAHRAASDRERRSKKKKKKNHSSRGSSNSLSEEASVASEETTSSLVRRAREMHLQKARARRTAADPIEEVEEDESNGGPSRRPGTTTSSTVEGSTVLTSSSSVVTEELDDDVEDDGPKRVRFTNKRRPGKG